MFFEKGTQFYWSPVLNNFHDHLTFISLMSIIKGKEWWTMNREIIHYSKKVNFTKWTLFVESVTTIFEKKNPEFYQNKNKNVSNLKFSSCQKSAFGTAMFIGDMVQNTTNVSRHIKSYCSYSSYSWWIFRMVTCCVAQTFYIWGNLP